jgi:hypothetical protein
MKLLFTVLIACLVAILLELNIGNEAPAQTRAAEATVGVADARAVNVFVGNGLLSSGRCIPHPEVRALDGKPAMSRIAYSFMPLPDMVDTVKAQIDTRFYRSTDRLCSGPILAQEIKAAQLTLTTTPQRIRMQTSVMDQVGSIQANAHHLTLTVPPMSQPPAAINAGGAVRLDKLLYPIGYFTEAHTTEYLATILEHEPSGGKTVIALIAPNEKLIDLRRVQMLTITR